MQRIIEKKKKLILLDIKQNHISCQYYKNKMKANKKKIRMVMKNEVYRIFRRNHN